MMAYLGVEARSLVIVGHLALEFYEIPLGAEGNLGVL